MQIEKSVEGVLRFQTYDCRMVGADETTELWRLPHWSKCLLPVAVERLHVGDLIAFG